MPIFKSVTNTFLRLWSIPCR